MIKRYKYQLIILFFTIGIVSEINSYIKWNKRNDKYLQDLNLHLTGKILAVDQGSGYNGFGIVKVKVIDSNKKRYDPRGKINHYYCLIKDSIAEVYQTNIGLCKPGDTIKINTPKKEFILKNGKKFYKYSIIVSENDQLYKYIKEHHPEL